MILPHDANPKPDGIFGKDTAWAGAGGGGGITQGLQRSRGNSYELRVSSIGSARDVVEFLSVLLQITYDLPHQIKQYRARKGAQ